MKRIVVEWDGPSVQGLAVTVLHFPDTVSDPSLVVSAFFQEIRLMLTSDHTITVPGSGDVIDEATGDLTGVWTGAGFVVMTGNLGPQPTAAGVGACITWLTSGIVSSRRVRGRTFIVPIPVANYDPDGTLTSGALTRLDTAAAILQPSLAVWHRPTAAGGGSDGSEHPAVDYRIRDKVAFLSSRRD